MPSEPPAQITTGLYLGDAGLKKSPRGWAEQRKALPELRILRTAVLSQEGGGAHLISPRHVMVAAGTFPGSNSRDLPKCQGRCAAWISGLPTLVRCQDGLLDLCDL